MPATDFEEFVNYKGVEPDPEVYTSILGFRDCGFLKEFDTLQDCRDFLGADPVLSKFGCIVQERRNHVTGVVKVKRRIILDTKQSKVKYGTRCGYRSVLPRVTDAIFWCT